MGSKTWSYNENFNSMQQQAKNVDSSRKHQKRKQVFGEIKNVIHNQGIATPLKPCQLSNNTPFEDLQCTDIISETIPNESKAVCNFKSPKTQYALSELSYFDYFDFRVECCSKSYKSDQQIWSEMNLYDDSFLNQIINADQQHQDDEPIYQVFNYEESENSAECLNDLKDEFNYNYWPDAKNLQGDCNMQLYL